MLFSNKNQHDPGVKTEWSLYSIWSTLWGVSVTVSWLLPLNDVPDSVSSDMEVSGWNGMDTSWSRHSYGMLP